MSLSKTNQVGAGVCVCLSFEITCGLLLAAPCILDGLTECGLSLSPSGINVVEVCFCSSDCVDFGDCCRDFRLLANCSVGG